jgi:parallel beta-helix repeat protein
VRDNNGCGIQVTSLRGGTGTTVYNNTVTRNAQEGIYVYDSAPGTVIQNNIAYNNGGSYQAIRNDSTGSTVDHNVTTNPQFVNALANDFSLQAGSPAIDAGVVVSAITKDFKGTPRPRGVAYDIGAYEYSEGPTSLPAPKNLHMVVK